MKRYICISIPLREVINVRAVINCSSVNIVVNKKGPVKAVKPLSNEQIERLLKDLVL